MQCPTMCYKTKQTVSLMCVCGGGREGAVSLCKLCLQLPSKEKQYKHIELVLATKSSSSLSEVIERVGFNEHTPHQVTAYSDSGKL